MNAPGLWIMVPGFAAFGLYLLRRWEHVVQIVGIILMLLLALLAWRLPIGEPISLGLPGLPALKLGENLLVLGRPLTLDNSMRPMLILIYLAFGLWFGGAYTAHTDRLFIPLATGIAALLTASLAVEPDLYSVLIIEIIALVCVPILSPPGTANLRGAMRFLTFQTIGMCFILAADWLMSVALSAPDQANLIIPTLLLLGLGFALVTAVFPFHTWIPMLAEGAHPYPMAFVFLVMPMAITFLGLDYLTQLTNIAAVPLLVMALRAAGVLMVVMGGLWAAFERHLGRIFGYAAIVQIGMALLIISVGIQEGANSPLMDVVFAQLIPQGVGLALWAQALSAIRAREADLRFQQVQGMGHHLPIATASLILANFSLAGLPLLASFPGYVGLWSALTQNSLPSSVLSLIGNACLMAAGLRSLAVMVMGPGTESKLQIEWSLQSILLVAGSISLFVIGLLPQWLFPILSGMASIFTAQGR